MPIKFGLMVMVIYHKFQNKYFSYYKKDEMINLLKVGMAVQIQKIMNKINLIRKTIYFEFVYKVKLFKSTQKTDFILQQKLSTV